MSGIEDHSANHALLRGTDLNPAERQQEIIAKLRQVRLTVTVNNLQYCTQYDAEIAFPPTNASTITWNTTLPVGSRVSFSYADGSWYTYGNSVVVPTAGTFFTLKCQNVLKEKGRSRQP
ncbi:hypothetical protein D9619_011973 [Psilocybe cf. subviscida]|uniref:Uncharacterized protein n=1 Tax=Psilocybe cf. subviscida TaxID=2480587 RepID=A0A8H5B0X3_9AGAR|nr:hypothetical protein D9619_011973 [Psilocybe cf. subviscida]